MAGRSRMFSKGIGLVVLLLLAAPQGLLAEITQTGDYSPTWPADYPNPWVIPEGTLVKVGWTDYGKVTVTLGNVITSASPLAVGAYGVGARHMGDLEIQSGAQVTAPLASIGGYPFELIDGTYDPQNLSRGTGRVTVTGTNSSLTVGDGLSQIPLFVGYLGQGALSVASNAEVTANAVVLGLGPAATGRVTVDGGRLNATSELKLGLWAYQAGDDSADLVIQNGGLVTTGRIQIGGFQSTPSDQSGVPQAMLTALGYAYGRGTATVQANSTLDVSGPAYIGYSGTGTVNVGAQSHVYTRETALGIGPGSLGMVVVSGAQAGWDVTHDDDYEAQSGLPSGGLVIGGYGEGWVAVRHGGQMDVNDVVYVGGYNAGELPFTGTIEGRPLGATPTGTGTLTVMGNGSRVATEELLVGATGSGHLNVLDRATLRTTEAGIGVAPGSHGEAVVGGLMGTWDNPHSMFVGGYGEGRLTVRDTGYVTVGEGLYIGGFPPESFAGHELVYGEDPNGTGTVTVSGGGHLAAFNIGIGVEGTGTLRIRNGGFVESQLGVVGVLEGGTGTVTVDGLNSLWRISGQNVSSLAVDAAGHGTVTISNGGRIEVGATEEGGSKAVLSVADDITVGSIGQGTVSVANGGSVFSGSAIIGAAVDAAHDPAAQHRTHWWEPDPGTGTVTLTGQSQWYARDDVIVGFSGRGTLNVTDSLVTDRAGWLAFQPHVTGTATISGPLAEWNNQETLAVGVWGVGTLNVENGAYVSTQEASIGGVPFEFLGDVFDANLIADGTGSVNVSGAGSLLEVTSLATLHVGYSGAGTLNVRDLGEVHSESLRVGEAPSGVGTVLVDGAGSRISIDNDAILGAWGEGHLTVSNGAQVETGGLYVGGFDIEGTPGLDPNMVAAFGPVNGVGTVTVTGAGSALDVTGGGPLIVGLQGTGTLTIADQGVVTSGDSFIGYREGSTGTVNVTGTDSKWSVGGNLFVGGSSEAAGGTGLLNIGTGGLVDVTGEMTVWHTGTLAGGGTVAVQEATTLHNYGRIAPGSATDIGTLTVQGNVVFEPGSAYAVKIGPTTSDELDVQGDVTINGGTVEVRPRGTIVGAHDYEIIKGQTVAGTFDLLDTTLLRFTVGEPNLSYASDAVNLHVVAANFDDPGIVRTPNEQAVGGALQDLATRGGSDVTSALQAVTNADALRRAYDQLSGQSRPPLAPVAVVGTSRFLSTVTGRVQTLETGMMGGMFDSGSFAMNGPESRTDGGPLYNVAAGGQSIAVGHGSSVLADSQWGLWGRGYGLFGDRRTEDSVPGYSYHIYGGSVGLDYQLSERFLAGLVVGLSDGKVDFAGSRDNADFRALHVGLYNSLTWNRWYLDSVASYADLSYDTERFIDLTSERLRGDLNGYELAAYVEGGYNWDLSGSLLLQPLASLQYTYVHLGSYTETGGPSALSYDGQTHESMKGSLGARLTQQLFESASGLRTGLQLRGRWIHEFGDNQASVDTSFANNPGAVFTIHDAAIVRDSAMLGAGLATDITRQLRAYVDYDTRLNSDETVHVVAAALQYRW